MSKKAFKIYLIHHSHTDIGYTERQEKITDFHIEFIKQAIVASEKIHSGEKKEWKGYKWTCENFWGVEQFLNSVSDEWKKRFEEAVIRGDVEVTGNYLNMTELVDAEVLASNLNKSVAYAKSASINIDSAMTADIDGYSWGYCQALLDAGMKNLFSCVHTHHGMYPLRKNQTPFWWEAKSGERLLVWSGDHYESGASINIIPPKVLWKRDENNNWYLHDEIENQVTEGYDKAKNYIKKLNKQNYQYDFAPIMISGVSTDNAPPNPEIMTLVNTWNERYGEEICMEMITLHDFFKVLRQEEVEIPVYKGDWTDWWADGVGSTPEYTKLCREAQRKLKTLKVLNSIENCISNDEIEKIEKDIMLYAEHTWGYSSSVSRPWETMVTTVEARKNLYAINSHLGVSKAIDQVLKQKGEQTLEAGRALLFKVINPTEHHVYDIAKIYIDYWEINYIKNGFKVRRESDGKYIPYQLENVSRGTEINIPVELKALGEEVFYIEANDDIKSDEVFIPVKSTDRVIDIELLPGEIENDKISVNQMGVESPYVRISWDENGINSWVDKETGQDLIRKDRLSGAFTPIYELTPNEEGNHVAEHRRLLGRNRKGINVRRSIGKIKSVNIVSNGDLFAQVELKFEIKGCSLFTLLLTIYKDMKRIDATVHMNKDSVWNPENVYINLPFIAGDNSVLWAEKTGSIFRPRIDQLPGTCIDFYLLQEGLAYISNDLGVAISTPDTPLIHMGDLNYKPVVLHDDNQKDKNSEQVYSWPMNNMWETNFKASLGGFYEFRYSVLWGNEFSNEEVAINKCSQINQGLICMRYKKN